MQSVLAFEQRAPAEDVCADFGIKAESGQSCLFRYLVVFLCHSLLLFCSFLKAVICV
jgi:hypothetical protein